MGLIIKNGIKYVGDNSVELTQAQYDALPQAEKLNGTTYYITDGQNITTASAVTYDNTASGMTATDVQSAIDEVKGDIDEINTTDNPLFYWKTTLAHRHQSPQVNPSRCQRQTSRYPIQVDMFQYL